MHFDILLAQADDTISAMLLLWTGIVTESEPVSNVIGSYSQSRCARNTGIDLQHAAPLQQLCCIVCVLVPYAHHFHTDATQRRRLDLRHHHTVVLLNPTLACHLTGQQVSDGSDAH